MSLRQRMERLCAQIVDDARAVRDATGFQEWAGSKRAAAYTLSDLDLDNAEMHLSDALEEVRKTRAAKAAAVGVSA